MRVKVELSGYPSTGFGWVARPEPEEESFVDRFASEDDEDDFRIGGEIQTVFVYEDVPPGTELTFSYLRPWEKDVAPRVVVHMRVEGEI